MSTDSRNKGGWQQGRIPIQANGPARGNNGIYWIKMRGGVGRRLMRWVTVHYSAAHPRLTWLCVTSTAINNIPTITLVAQRMQYAKWFFKVVLPAYSYSLYSFHLLVGCSRGIRVSAVLF